jgi:hypothetical protein
MAVYDDLALWALALLKANEDVTGLVVAGAAGIMESGNLAAEALQDAQVTRRETGEADKVLAIVVVDTGEKGRVSSKTTSCGIYVCDRGGYGNIRAAREAVIIALLNQPVSLARSAMSVDVQYAARSGHMRNVEFNLDYERVDFSGDLHHDESDDLYS